MDTAGIGLDKEAVFPAQSITTQRSCLSTYVSSSGPRFLFKEGGSYISLIVGKALISILQFQQSPCYTHSSAHGNTTTEAHPEVRMFLNRCQAGRFLPLPCWVLDRHPASFQISFIRQHKQETDLW